MLKLAIIADIHHGPDFETKKGSAALGLLDEFIHFANALAPHAVIDLGDRITDTDYDNDLLRLKQVAQKFSAITVPHHHLLGNHDCGLLSVAENERALRASLTSHSIDLHGFHLVFWNCKTKTQPQGHLELASGDLDWLAHDLAATNLPTIIFSHVPLNNGSMRGNYYFERAWPEYGLYPEETGEAIRAVIERSGNVILCVNGHAHWHAYHCIDGIHYVTLPSLTETFTTSGQANAAWAELTLSETINLWIHGLTPMHFTLPIKPLHSHWSSMHKDWNDPSR